MCLGPRATHCGQCAAPLDGTRREHHYLGTCGRRCERRAIASGWFFLFDWLGCAFEKERRVAATGNAEERACAAGRLAMTLSSESQRFPEWRPLIDDLLRQAQA